MEDSNIQDWIKKQLSQGRNPQEIKQALTEKGYDPTLVDKANSTAPIGKEEFKDQIEKTESITDKLEEEIRKEWKPGLAVTLLILLGVAGTVLAGPITQALNTENPVQENNMSEQNQNNLNGNTTTVKLSNGVANPSRPSITQQENIQFDNQAGYDIRIVFESGKESIQIPSGETRKASFDSLTYYTAEPVEGEGEEISGSIIVQ